MDRSTDREDTAHGSYPILRYGDIGIAGLFWRAGVAFAFAAAELTESRSRRQSPHRPRTEVVCWTGALVGFTVLRLGADPQSTKPRKRAVIRFCWGKW